jgi:hypothetical protein
VGNVPKNVILVINKIYQPVQDVMEILEYHLNTVLNVSQVILNLFHQNFIATNVLKTVCNVTYRVIVKNVLMDLDSIL